MTTELSQKDIANILLQVGVGESVPTCYAHAETVEISFRGDDGESMVKVMELEGGKVISVNFEVA